MGWLLLWYMRIIAPVAFPRTMSSDRIEVLDGWVEERRLGGVGVKQRDVVAPYVASAVVVEGVASVRSVEKRCYRSRIILTRRSTSSSTPRDKLPISLRNDSLATAMSCPSSKSLSQSRAVSPLERRNRKMPGSSTSLLVVGMTIVEG